MYVSAMNTLCVQPEVASPGLTENRSEAVDTITVTYPTVKICTTSVSPTISYVLTIHTHTYIHTHTHTHTHRSNRH